MRVIFLLCFSFQPILGGKSHLDWPPSLNGSLLPVQHRLNNVEAKLDDFKVRLNIIHFFLSFGEYE